MPTFTWSVRDKSGQQVIREIAADTSDESRFILLAQGYSDLVLKEDEISNAAIAGLGRTQVMGQEITVTAEERLKHRDKRPGTLFTALAEGMWQSKGLLVIILCVGAYGFFLKNRTSIILAAVALIAWCGFIICVSLPLTFYRKLHKASDWHRWDEVTRLVNTLETIGKIHFIKIPPPELGRYRAKVLVGRGDLEAALQGYQQYENQPGCPSWLYKGFVAGLYDLAKQHDKAIEYTLMALAEKPSPVMYLDLANRYARFKKDPKKARQALEEAEKGPLPDLTTPGRHRYQGEVAFLEGDYALAKQELETAIRLMEATPNRPFRDGTISIGKAYLCCVLARLNDRQGAEKNYRAALPYLEATNETELIEECKIELGKK